MTVKIKSTEGGELSPQHPHEALGWRDCCLTFEVTNAPSLGEAVQAAKHTSIRFPMEEWDGFYEFLSIPFEDLGKNKVVKPSVDYQDWLLDQGVHSAAV